MRIVERAAEEDPRIRIITNEENIGPGPSRNRGIEVARGEYLSFVDPDDYVDDDYYEILYKTAKENHVDIVKGRCIPVDTNGNVDHSWWSCENTLKEGINNGELLFRCFLNEQFPALFSRSFVIYDHKLRYTETRAGEDSVFLLRLCLKEPTFTLAEDAVYYHLIRPDSLKSTLSYENVEEGLKALNDRIEILNEASFPKEGYSYMQGSVEYYIRRFISVYRADMDQKERTKEYHVFCDELNRILSKAPEPERIKKGHKQYQELL